MTDSSSGFSISRIMHRHVVTVPANATVQDCARRIAAEHVGCLIVVDGKKPMGIITERSFVDLLKLGPCNPARKTAADIMSDPLVSIKPDAGFANAMELFNTKGIKRIPVVRRGAVVGLLTLKNMVEYSNLALSDLQDRHRKLRSQASIDPLTGILNKAATTKALHREYERIKRYGGRSSILFIDIDHFKLVNDTWSHLAGDAILAQLGTLFKSVCRGIDTIGRFGGEEFLIIAPNRKKYHAVRFGTRLRREVAGHCFTYQKKHIRLTISLGIASLFDGRDCALALERADKALYHAKDSGRNRVGLWREGKLAVADSLGLSRQIPGAK